MIVTVRGEIILGCILAVTTRTVGGSHTLRMAAETWDPFYRIAEGNDGRVVYSGVMKKVMDYLRSSLNLTTFVVRPPDGSWGVRDTETGRWSGMVGMVHRNEVDFALGKLQMILKSETYMLSTGHY